MGFHPSRGQVDALAGDDLTDVLHAQPVLLQDALRHPDAELALGESLYRHQRDLGELLQPCLQLLCIGFQIGHGHGAGDGDGNHLVGTPELFHGRQLRDLGKVVDGFHFRFDVLEKAVDLAFFLHLHRRCPDPLQCLATDLVHALDAVYGFLQTLTDGLLDVLGAGAGVNDAHFHFLGCEIRKSFALEGRQGGEPEHDKAQHQ